MGGGGGEGAEFFFDTQYFISCWFLAFWARKLPSQGSNRIIAAFAVRLPAIQGKKGRRIGTMQILQLC